MSLDSGDKEVVSRTRKIRAASVALIVGLVVFPTPPRFVSHAAGIEDEQVPIGNYSQAGMLHFIMDDGMEPEFNDPPSMLTVESNQSAGFCTSANVAPCAGNRDLWFIANLPLCSASITTDCVRSVTATTSAGTTATGTFETQFPTKGPLEFTGNPSIGLPTGAAQGIWRIPGAPHVGGDRYAVVARLRGKTSDRARASFQLFIVPVEIQTGVDSSPSYQLPTWLSPGNPGGGSTADLGVMRCALWGDSGSCALRRPFPEGVSFEVSVKLSTEPSGWLHGRLSDPTVSFDADGSSTIVTVKGSPVVVPAVQVAGQHSTFSSAIQATYSPDGKYSNAGSRIPNGGQNLTDLSQRNAIYVLNSYDSAAFEHFDNLKSSFNDTASYAPTYWRIRTLSASEMTGASECLKTGNGVKGLVTTNAMMYGSGPPALSADKTTLDYKIAAPHFTRTGAVFTGNYNLAVRSDIADCLYGLSNNSPAPTVAYSEEDLIIDEMFTDDGGFESKVDAGEYLDEEPMTIDEVTIDEVLADETAKIIENPVDYISVTKASLTDQLVGGPNTTVVERDGWIYFSATNITFSTPQVKVQMSEIPARKIFCMKSGVISQVTARGSKCPSDSTKARVQHCVKGRTVKVAVGSNPRCAKGYARATAITCAKGAVAQKAIGVRPLCAKGYTRVTSIYCVKDKAARVVTAAQPTCGNGFKKATYVTCRKGAAKLKVLTATKACPKGYRKA